MRYFVQFSYNGTAYAGMQKQPNAISIQEVLEDVLSKKCREKIQITAAGRTDAGVHAHEMFAHFDVDKPLQNDIHSFNAFLPKDIALQKFIPVKQDAHARFDAISREYKYYISTEKNPFSINSYGIYPQKLDVNRMNEAAKKLFNYIDFTSFAKLHTDTKTNNCKIYKAVWEQQNSELVFTIQADRFLRNMVRSIVGTLLLVGKGKISVQDFCTIIEKKNRNTAGESVPAKGLFLHKITYPLEIFIYEK